MAETSGVISFIESLESPCSECEGNGFRKDTYSLNEYACVFCNGTGYVLSDAGEHVVAFIGRMLRRTQFRTLRS
jgi:hypothetical protein